jgi:isochorismate synthase
MARVVVARARRLGPAFDLLAAYGPPWGAFFERQGIGLAASGVARRVAAPRGPRRIAAVAGPVLEALARLSVEDDPEALEPVAVGGFPFDDGAPAALTIPHRVVRRERRGEPTWELTLGPEGAHEEAPSANVAAGGPHDERAPDLSAVPEPERYADAVRSAVQRIRAGKLAKVVLARTVVAETGRRLDPSSLLHRLRVVDPDCTTFAVPVGEPEQARVLVGATPELLVRRRGREIEANPLAGSAPRGGDAGSDRASAERLLASDKDREEHAHVVEGVVGALAPFCDELEADEEPSTLATANVWHISTKVRGVLREPAPTVLELVGALHPTPAICGTPREAARAAIAELEPIDRGIYSGPVGWIDANGDGEWAIALRCAELSGSIARLFAGAGIVAGSDPDAEVDETEPKFRALLDALRWG